MLEAQTFQMFFQKGQKTFRLSFYNIIKEGSKVGFLGLGSFIDYMP